ncbi:MAG: TlyA family RNA methyltransferase [Bacillota bacterium]|jgi:23S rRNA (cytidine1920-2'-O)/16S rRNA (cytidine1409-2'-O)-methyltransferase|nr:TlyA family RNA methyltransferase [Bacillota bacterium]
MAAERKRLDILLAERGIFASRSEAKAAIKAGLVSIDGQRAEKPGMQVRSDAVVEVKELPRYVSRGGLKLEKALSCFGIDLAGRTAMDVGASTGGFTDCMLQHGAAKVYSIDVGYNQFDRRLRQDRRVVLLERTNIRYLPPEAIPEAVDFAAVDVSFISLELVLPALKGIGVGEIVALVKPQFEVGKGQIGKRGVVREPAKHYSVLQKLAAVAGGLGYAVINATFSPVRGPEGNIEYLLHLRKEKDSGQVKLPDFKGIIKEARQVLA